MTKLGPYEVGPNDTMENGIFLGDCRELAKAIPDESIDLIYLDPPFNSNRVYNVLDNNKQIKAFEDIWKWDKVSIESYQEIIDLGDHVSCIMQTFQTLLGNSNMLAYLSMMAPRLVELRRVLKSTGSIYLHCNPTASHYLKLLMDVIFGVNNFRNEIVWSYASGGASKRHFAKKHDIIFRYTINNHSTPNVERRSGFHPDGRMLTDVWRISFLSTTASERLGYPTQKPETLMERIIKVSSNEGDIIFDPFCGSGTTAIVAQNLDRQYLAFDINTIACKMARQRTKQIGPLLF